MIAAIWYNGDTLEQLPGSFGRWRHLMGTKSVVRNKRLGHIFFSSAIPCDYHRCRSHRGVNKRHVSMTTSANWSLVGISSVAMAENEFCWRFRLSYDSTIIRPNYVQGLRLSPPILWPRPENRAGIVWYSSGFSVFPVRSNTQQLEIPFEMKNSWNFRRFLQFLTKSQWSRI